MCGWPTKVKRRDFLFPPPVFAGPRASYDHLPRQRANARAGEADLRLDRQMIARKYPRIVAVIQARMGSTRLPGKVLRPVAGKPLLWHIVHRLKASQLIDEIAIATTVNPLDEAIVEFGATHGVTVIRGSIHRYAPSACR